MGFPHIGRHKWNSRDIKTRVSFLNRSTAQRMFLSHSLLYAFSSPLPHFYCFWLTYVSFCHYWKRSHFCRTLLLLDRQHLIPHDTRFRLETQNWIQCFTALRPPFSLGCCVQQQICDHTLVSVSYLNGLKANQKVDLHLKGGKLCSHPKEVSTCAWGRHLR